MKLTELQYEVKVEVELTGFELAVIMECGSNHYDGVCKAAAKCGGFLWGTRNRLLSQNEWPQSENMYDHAKLVVRDLFSSRELDTICKILEMPSCMKESAEQIEVRASVPFIIRRIFGTMDAKRKFLDKRHSKVDNDCSKP